jgi:glutathione S-transferase
LHVQQEENKVLAYGQPSLCGNQFTAADLTFAALAGFLKSQLKNFCQRWLNSLFH